jgi:hypothetical protein
MIPRILPGLSALALFAGITAQAQASALDVEASLCVKDVNGGGTGQIYYYGPGVSNLDQVNRLQVVCPIVLQPGTSRVVYIGGQDANASVDFSCWANGWDVNLAPVAMPTITMGTGFTTQYRLTSLGSFVLPDSVVKLVVTCQIPAYQPAQSEVWSQISDFLVQW